MIAEAPRAVAEASESRAHTRGRRRFDDRGVWSFIAHLGYCIFKFWRDRIKFGGHAIPPR